MTKKTKEEIERHVDRMSDASADMEGVVKRLIVAEAEKVCPDNPKDQLGFIVAVSAAVFAASIHAATEAVDGENIPKGFAEAAAELIAGMVVPELEKLIELATGRR